MKSAICGGWHQMQERPAAVAAPGGDPYHAFMDDPYQPFDLRTKAGWRALIGVLYLMVGGVMVAVILRS